MTNNIQKIKDEIIADKHIKWLEKAKTVKIDGVELTVLPYGYLSQAIGELLDELEIAIREDEREKKDKVWIKFCEVIKK